MTRLPSWVPTGADEIRDARGKLLSFSEGVLSHLSCLAEHGVHQLDGLELQALRELRYQVVSFCWRAGLRPKRAVFMIAELCEALSRERNMSFGEFEDAVEDIVGAELPGGSTIVTRIDGPYWVADVDAESVYGLKFKIDIDRVAASTFGPLFMLRERVRRYVRGVKHDKGIKP